MTDEEAKAQADAMHKAAFDHQVGHESDRYVVCRCESQFADLKRHAEHRRAMVERASAPFEQPEPVPERHLDRSEAERAEDIRAVTKVAWQWFLGFREVGFGYESSLRLVMSMLRDDGPM